MAGHTSASSNERGFKRDSSPVSEIDTESGDFKGKSFAAEAVRKSFFFVCARRARFNECGKSRTFSVYWPVGVTKIKVGIPGGGG